MALMVSGAVGVFGALNNFGMCNTYQRRPYLLHSYGAAMKFEPR
jgi:hypothetical protein